METLSAFPFVESKVGALGSLLADTSKDVQRPHWSIWDAPQIWTMPICAFVLFVLGLFTGCPKCLWVGCLQGVPSVCGWAVYRVSQVFVDAEGFGGAYMYLCFCSFALGLLTSPCKSHEMCIASFPGFQLVFDCVNTASDKSLGTRLQNVFCTRTY